MKRRFWKDDFLTSHVLDTLLIATRLLWSLYAYFKHTLPLAHFPRSDFPSVWFFIVGFSSVVFLDAHFIAVGKSQTKVRRIFSHRMEPVGRIIFQCPIGNAIVRSAIILNPYCRCQNCFCSIMLLKTGWYIIHLSLAPSFIFISWFLKTSVAFTLNLWVSELPLPDKRKTYVSNTLLTAIFITLHDLFIFNQSSKQQSL